jgi:hypothetical protein
MKLTLHKILHWEYWPFHALYFPVFFLWGYFALRERSLFFFNAVNPSMKNGGFFMVSKAKIYSLIPSHYYPKTCLVHPGLSIEEVAHLMQENGLTFPLIAKPDMGQRGSAVKKMDSILTSIEKDPGFINLSIEQLYGELENIPSQEDYDYFCNFMNLEKKLDKSNSSQKEKLFTILYTIGNNCIGPDINLKKIILSIIKYELTRNELVEIIRKYNKDNGQLDMLDFITADMMFMSLGNFLSHPNMKIISRNIAYYFSKIC